MSQTIENRVGILLSLFGNETSTALMEQLPDDQADSLKAILDEQNLNPPSDDQIDEAVEEFQRSLSLVVEDEDEDQPAATKNEQAEDAIAEATGDAIWDLQQLSPSQLATVLEAENPRAAAIILSCVEADVAANALSELPEATGEAVFLCSQKPLVVADDVRRLLVEKAFQRGRVVPKEKPIAPTVAAIERLAEMLRKMDRTTRAAMLSRLKEADAETAEQVSDKLYLFEDLLFVADRSVQSLLTEVNSSTLSTALGGADPAITDKVLSNMSKRARASLLEEIEFLGSVSDEELEHARGELCKAMAKLDEKGELEVVES